MPALNALQPMLSQASAPPAGRSVARPWMSVDLGALALALDGARPLPTGSARLIAWGGPAGIARRVPASAFVDVRRRVAEDAVTSASRQRAGIAPGSAAESNPAIATAAAEPVRATPAHPLRRERPIRIQTATAAMPLRHKLMLAAAAVVMTLGFLGAGVGHVGQAASAAPATVPRAAG